MAQLSGAALLSMRSAGHLPNRRAAVRLDLVRRDLVDRVAA
jgi:hypothetical protein